MNSRVVNQDINSALVRLESCEARLHLRALRHIKASAVHHITLTSQKPDRVGEAGSIDVVQHDLCARGGEATRERQPDALSRAGDERPPSREGKQCGMRARCVLGHKSGQQRYATQRLRHASFRVFSRAGMSV